MSSDLNAEVVAMVCEVAGVRPRGVTQATTLFGELGIDGDDAVELFEELAQRFQVDLTGLHLGRHFGPEAGGDPFTTAVDLIHFLWVKDWHRVAGVEPITVSDLVEAARLGRWHKA